MEARKTVIVILAVLLSTAVGTVWYVHPDSTQDSIQPCLDACGAGDTVLVAAGTYHEKLVWPDIQGVRLLSESGRDSTVIDGDSSGTVITIAVEVDTTTAIEGFTIADGYTNSWGGGIFLTKGGPMIRNNTLTENHAYSGGAICVSSSDSIYIVDNRFVRNHVTGYGGAAYLYNGTAIVSGNLFERNLADSNAGAVILYMESGLVQGNAFTGNRADRWHGGLECWGGTAAIVRNTFTYDSCPGGGGALTFVSCSPNVTGNIVRQCYAGPLGSAAVCCLSSSPTFVGDTFTDNVSTGNWGAIGCEEGSSPHFSRCLIAGNAWDMCGAVKTSDSSSPTFDSCTITGNDCSGVYVGTGSHPSISNSNIYGNLGYGVRCQSYADSIDACNNWWGDSTGPFHPDSNPGGRGDTVSDGVFFRPWLQDSVFFPGVLESYVQVPVGLPTQATIVRGVLFLAEATSDKPEAANLMDIAGREVMKLKPGANDVNRLGPGVYFIREGLGTGGEGLGKTQKVVVAR